MEKVKESKDETGTKRQSKCAAKKLRELPVRHQFIVQVYLYLVLKCDFYLPLGTHVRLITEHSQEGEVYRAQSGFSLYSHHTIYHLQDKNPMHSAVPAYSKAFCSYTGER